MEPCTSEPTPSYYPDRSQTVYTKVIRTWYTKHTDYCDKAEIVKYYYLPVSIKDLDDILDLSRSVGHTVRFLRNKLIDHQPFDEERRIPGLYTVYYFNDAEVPAPSAQSFWEQFRHPCWYSGRLTDQERESIIGPQFEFWNQANQAEQNALLLIIEDDIELAAANERSRLFDESSASSSDLFADHSTRSEDSDSAAYGSTASAREFARRALPVATTHIDNARANNSGGLPLAALRSNRLPRGFKHQHQL